MSPLAWRILMIFIDHAKQRNKNEEWYNDYPGYIASWDLDKMLGGDANTINPVNTKINPRNEQETALKELLDLGLVEEMEELHCRYRLIVKEPAKDVTMRYRLSDNQTQNEKPVEPTVASYWTYPPSVQGKIREKVDLDELLSDL